MMVQEYLSEIKIEFRPTVTLIGKSKRLLNALYDIFGGSTVSVFMGIENGETVLRAVGMQNNMFQINYQNGMAEVSKILNEKI